ncbi:MAG: ATP-dependent DNA helicase [Actinomycetota bacterium]|nr:ATP-dependent DNA helicase [Actinomycetota bacterium]
MKKEIIETQEQLNIINSSVGVKRIIACAGSGKTHTITSSIIKILNEEICSPDNILVLTFTRNAAENMRARVGKNIKTGIDSESIDIFTFNSFGNDIISENNFEFGLGKDFNIINSSQSWQIIYEIFDELNFEYIKAKKKEGEFVQNLLNYIENLKNNLISVSEFREYLDNYTEILSSYKSKALRRKEEESINIQRELFFIYQEYENRKMKSNCIDYSDQVFLPYFLLKERKSIRARYSRRYKYIFVDEFQDTNVAQAYLLSLLYEPDYNRLVVVGDDDQGIYSFRGACVENILDFHKFDKFKDHPVYDFYLTTNFRSGSNIINTINNIISANKKRFTKELKPESIKKESEVIFYSKKTHTEEAFEIAEMIKHLASEGVSLKEIAILARRKRFEKIIKALDANGIKYELIGGKNFFFEPEILFIVSWLKIIEDINDEISLSYILKSDKYKICDRDIYFIKRKPENPEEKVSLINGILDSAKNPHISEETKKRLKDFLTSLGLYIKNSGELELKELVSLIVEDSGMMSELRSKFGPTARRKIKNIESLIKVSSDFQQSYSRRNLSSFITYLRDVAKTDYDNPETIEFSGENSVKIMSIHAAKGLEFEVVFLPALWKSDYMGRNRSKDYMIPAGLRKDNSLWKEIKNYKSEVEFKKALDNIKFEEERRIFYVACSRAKRMLVLSYSEFEDDEACSNESARPKEIVPFFDDIVNKDNDGRLRIVNREGLEFIRNNYDKKLYNNYYDYMEVFNFAGLTANDDEKRKNMKIKENKRNNLLFTEKKLSDLQKKLASDILRKISLDQKEGKINKEGENSSGDEESEIIRRVNMAASLIAGDSYLHIKKDENFFPLTQILDYKKCPLLYKWKYVYLIPEKSSEELEWGEKLHKYIENITLAGFNSNRQSSNTGIIEQGKANNKITEDMIISQFEDDDTRKCIENFLKSKCWDFSEVESLMLEQLFYWKVKNFFVVGKFDRVDIKKNGEIRVIDYKLSDYFQGECALSCNQSNVTGDINSRTNSSSNISRCGNNQTNKNSSVSTDFGSQNNANSNLSRNRDNKNGNITNNNLYNLYFFQLQSYIAALSWIYKKPVRDITGFLLYLKDGVEKSINFRDGEIEELKQDITSVINNILNNNFNANFTDSCKRRCSYSGFCQSICD